MTCPRRAAPPINRQPDVDENRSTVIPYPLHDRPGGRGPTDLEID
jgi:hypothetical protein